MKNCPKCGAQLADDDNYCYFCGSDLDEFSKEKREREDLQFNDQKDDNYYYQTQARNGFALAGFIVAFFSPMVGLILSIIGLNKSKDMKGLGRGQAIAGIIISICNFILSFAIYSIYYAMYYGRE